MKVYNAIIKNVVAVEACLTNEQRARLKCEYSKLDSVSAEIKQLITDKCLRDVCALHLAFKLCGIKQREDMLDYVLRTLYIYINCPDILRLCDYEI